MDRITESLKNKHIVFWEEIARDGAQAKTILSAQERIEIASKHAEMFNEHGPDHLVFGVGFISISPEEARIIEETSEQVDNCYLGVNCRSSENEIMASYHAVKKAKYGRIAYVLPASERLCEVMLHKSPQETLERGRELARFALDNTQGMPIDVQLAGAFDGDPAFIAELASVLTEEGIATVGMGDTRGGIYPCETERFLDSILNKSSEDVLYSVHFHDDLGFSLTNNLKAIERGILLPSTSWLGLAERNGLLRTELLTVLLAHEPEKLKDRLNIDGEKLFKSPPNLKLIKEIAETVSRYTGIPIKITDPIVGPGLNSISTGTPFVDRDSFRPFNPQKVLGIPEEIYVTHLASIRLVKTVSKQMGFHFSDEALQLIVKELKETVYKSNQAVIQSTELKLIFKNYIKNETNVS
jgi:2-isopropylmalate synthase